MASRFLAAAAALTALTPIAAQAQQGSALPTPVEQQQLRALDAWSVGALSRADGALAPDLWNQSDPASLAVVLDRLPSIYESPATQTLARRVLYSGGDAPRGDATLAARKRFEALGKMGAADQLATMASGAGATAQNDLGIAMFAAQAELARGRRAEACSRGRNADGGATPPAFLLRLRAYCAAVGGDRAAADLALEVARSQNAADAWYTAAVSAAAGAPPARPPAARYDNSLSAQLSIAANLRPAANPFADASTLALVAVARNDHAPQPQRAQAAVLAFRRGGLSAAETRTILQATPADVTTGLPPIATALRQVTASPGTMQAATAIAGMLAAASAPADFTAVARLFHDEIVSAPAAPDAAGAVLFARAAIAAGDGSAGQRLAASARQAGADETALAPLDAALAALAGVRNDSGGVAVQRRIDNAGRNSASAARDVAVLAALGAPMDGAAQAFLLANPPQGGARADSGAMLALASAVERGAVGEGALLAVAAAGQAGPARLDTESVERIVRALRGLGLEADARRIAAEVILAGAPNPPAPARTATPAPRR